MAHDPMQTMHEILGEAVQHHQSGRLSEAERVYRQIVEIDPAHADALHLLGVLLCQRGLADDAVDYIQRAIAVNNSAAVFQFNLGVAYRALGQTDSAVECFERAVTLHPNAADAHHQLGAIFETRGETTRAVEAFRIAVECQPDNAGFRFRLGSALAAAGQYQEAVDHLQAAIQHRPDDANTHNSLGSVFQKLGRLDDAAAEYETAIRLHPEFGPYHFNLGNVLREQDRLEQAVKSYTEAVRLVPDDAEASVNLGVALKEQGRLDESLACYERLLGHCSEFTAARFNRSLVLLQQGNFGLGWDEYEWRWEHGKCPRQFAQPQWDGSTLTDRSIFIHAEQGVGDEIQFAACLPDVLTGARQCTLACDSRLVPLFARSFPSARVVAKPCDAELASAAKTADVQIAIGSLPRFLRRRFEDFPARVGYLHADEQQRALWKSRLDSLGTGLKVGISWRGGKEADVRRKRSVPLTLWSQVLAAPEVRFINLQYGSCADELEQARRNMQIEVHHWQDVDPLRNLDDFAAQISALDLVISVDNATVHMAGALGRPVWTMLPFASDWRWMLRREDTPWYPTMRLFRQTRPGDWSHVFQRIANELQHFKDNRSGQFKENSPDQFNRVA